MPCVEQEYMHRAILGLPILVSKSLLACIDMMGITGYVHVRWFHLFQMNSHSHAYCDLAAKV